MDIDICDSCGITPLCLVNELMLCPLCDLVDPPYDKSVEREPDQEVLPPGDGGPKTKRTKRQPVLVESSVEPVKPVEKLACAVCVQVLAPGQKLCRNCGHSNGYCGSY